MAKFKYRAIVENSIEGLAVNLCNLRICEVQELLLFLLAI
jgi:hypothetical protein